jgi:hypothetical protein
MTSLFSLVLLLLVPFYSFLSSWERGEVNTALWHEVVRVAIVKDTRWVWVIQLIKHSAKRGTYLLAPHSPIIVGDYFWVLKKITPDLKALCIAMWSWFVRINGVTPNTKESLGRYKSAWYLFAPIHAHVEESNVLDLTLDEETLLANMRKTTRYMIKRAYKEWVVVKKENTQESIQKFIEQHQKHAKRTNGKANYVAFSPSFIKSLFTYFDDTQISCFNAYYEWVLEATVISICFGDWSVYYLGVSDIKHPKFSPAYVCQREAIKYAKSIGCKHHNFWWVSPDDNKKHPLRWPTMFKRGFWGTDHYLTHAHDLICSPKYWFTYVIEWARRHNRWYYYVRPTV